MSAYPLCSNYKSAADTPVLPCIRWQHTTHTGPPSGSCIACMVHAYQIHAFGLNRRRTPSDKNDLTNTPQQFKCSPVAVSALQVIQNRHSLPRQPPNSNSTQMHHTHKNRMHTERRKMYSIASMLAFLLIGGYQITTEKKTNNFYTQYYLRTISCVLCYIEIAFIPLCANQSAEHKTTR